MQRPRGRSIPSICEEHGSQWGPNAVRKGEKDGRGSQKNSEDGGMGMGWGVAATIRALLVTLKDFGFYTE